MDLEKMLNDTKSIVKACRKMGRDFTAAMHTKIWMEAREGARRIGFISRTI